MFVFLGLEKLNSYLLGIQENHERSGRYARIPLRKFLCFFNCRNGRTYNSTVVREKKPHKNNLSIYQI
jgi:hypothetical protein